MLLALRGHRVLLVDRSKFPSDIPHGFFIHRGGPARLHRWGVLDRILATGCPAVDTILWDLTGFPLIGRGVAIDGVAFGCGPRRKVLDQILIEAAVEAGAEFRPQFIMEDVLTEDDRVTGVRGRQTSGSFNCSRRSVGGRKTSGSSTWRDKGSFPPSSSSIQTTFNASWRASREARIRTLSKRLTVAREWRRWLGAISSTTSSAPRTSAARSASRRRVSRCV